MGPNPSTDVGSELPEPIVLRPEVPEAPRRLAEPGDLRMNARRQHITKGDLARHGLTSRCPACDAIQAGRPRGGDAHSESCRERLEKAMETDPRSKDRVEKTRQRLVEKIAQRIEDQERHSKRVRREMPPEDQPMGGGTRFARFLS